MSAKTSDKQTVWKERAIFFLNKLPLRKIFFFILFEVSLKKFHSFNATERKKIVKVLDTKFL